MTTLPSTQTVYTRHLGVRTQKHTHALLLRAAMFVSTAHPVSDKNVWNLHDGSEVNTDPFESWGEIKRSVSPFPDGIFIIQKVGCLLSKGSLSAVTPEGFSSGVDVCSLDIFILFIQLNEKKKTKKKTSRIREESYSGQFFIVPALSVPNEGGL